MATSGTVGQTVITTDKLMDHAVRRCGLPASMQTPETVEAAKECLFMLLVHLANRGLNLWCVDRSYIPLVSGKLKYSLPSGTLSVLNVEHSRPSLASGTQSSNATSVTQALDSAQTLIKFGLDITGALPTATVTVEVSDDGATWASVKTVAVASLSTGYNWFDLDPSASCSYIRASVGVGTLTANLLAVTEVRDLTVTQISRDTYSQQVNKTQTGDYPTDYFFEKNLAPSLSLWPVPNNSNNFLSVWLHRQVQDVGGLFNEVAIPTRWFESIVRHLAFSLSMELPGVDPNRILLLKGLADEAVITAELDETDMAPIMIAPAIGAYTS